MQVAHEFGSTMCCKLYSHLTYAIHPSSALHVLPHVVTINHEIHHAEVYRSRMAVPFLWSDVPQLPTRKKFYLSYETVCTRPSVSDFFNRDVKLVIGHLCTILAPKVLFLTLPLGQNVSVLIGVQLKAQSLCNIVGTMSPFFQNCVSLKKYIFLEQ